MPLKGAYSLINKDQKVDGNLCDFSGCDCLEDGVLSHDCYHQTQGQGHCQQGSWLQGILEKDKWVIQSESGDLIYQLIVEPGGSKVESWV